MSNNPIKLKSNTFVAIDWSNVYNWHDNLDWEIDPQKLYNYINGLPNILGINFYFGQDDTNKKTDGFHDLIEKIGYNLVSKEVKWIPVCIEKSHFKKVIKDLFDTLDDVKNTNSEISNKLYEINKKVEGLPKISIGRKGVAYSLSNEKQLQEIYDMID
jgi:hypothetical protein